MADTIKFREGSSGHIDLTAQEQTGTDGDGNPIYENYEIGDKRVVVMLKDNEHQRGKVAYDSSVDNSRIEVEPDDGSGSLTGVVRIWPKFDIFRTSWSPYTIFMWIYLTSSDKIDFPRDKEGFTVEILPAWGTHDL